MTAQQFEPAWSGSGVPPAGAEVECQGWDEVWRKGTVIAHGLVGFLVRFPGLNEDVYIHSATGRYRKPAQEES